MQQRMRQPIEDATLWPDFPSWPPHVQAGLIGAKLQRAARDGGTPPSVDEVAQLIDARLDCEVGGAGLRGDPYGKAYVAMIRILPGGKSFAFDPEGARPILQRAEAGDLDAIAAVCDLAHEYAERGVDVPPPLVACVLKTHGQKLARARRQSQSGA